MTAAPQLTDDYLMDQETEAEITEAVEAETVSDTPWTPSPEDEDRVEHYLRALRYYRAEEERVKAAALAECERIGEWERKHLRTPRGAIDYLTHQLEMFSEATGRGKHDSPNGTLRWRKGRERIEIENEDAFCDSHGDTNLVRRTATPDKGAIKAYIQATGEIPDGADIVRGHDVFVALTPETQP